MQIRGEAAIACGFMAGLATGLLFDGCFDSYINRFRDPGFSSGKSNEQVSECQKMAMPGESRGIDVSTANVIVTKSGKRYHNDVGCKGLPRAAIRTNVPLAAAINRGKTPCPVCCPPTA